MICLHSKKLLYIRKSSRSKKIHILRTYTYLRDANAKSFNDIALNEAMWTKLHELETKNCLMAEAMSSTQAGKSKSGKDKEEKKEPCPHCKSKALHQHAKVVNTKAACPLKGYKAETAREIVRTILCEYNKDKDKGIAAVIEEIKATTPEDG